MARGHSADRKHGHAETGVHVANTAGARMIPAVASAVREAALCYGLPAGAADELREACQALFRRVAASYFGEAEQGRLDVTIIRRPGQVVVRIDDQAVPYELVDSAGRGPGTAIAQAQLLELIRERVDRFNFVYRGRAGNRVELVKRTTRHRPARNGPPEAQPIDPDQPVEVRPMVAADAIAFVRNDYHSYGYTYESDWAYSAEDISELLESGLLTAWVAVTPEGAIVGQAAVRRDPPDARLGEGGAAMVDPAFRHHGVGIKLGLAALEWIQQQQLFGVFGFATTRHPYSQKAFVDMGGHELALLLGFIPASVAYRSIDELGEGRSAAMVMYQGLGPNPAHEVHAPPQHRDMLRRIYEAGRLRGDFVEATTRPEPTGQTRVDVYVRTDHNVARIEVTRIGSELVEAVRLHLERLAQGGIAGTYVDLPLSLPETPQACDVLERLGLSFAGVFPFDDRAGMRLRLQYLDPDVMVERDDIKVASDFGAELRDYILAARAPAHPPGGPAHARP